MNRCQLVGVPGGTRDDGRRQLVYYFNPAALPGACTRSTATAGKAA